MHMRMVAFVVKGCVPFPVVGRYLQPLGQRPSLGAEQIPPACGGVVPQPLGVLPAALAGALMAFLLWNFYPAKLRPGAVGCQFLAGALGCVPLSVGWPGLTLPLALPYWLEGGMVALQIIVWKASGGRRQLFGTAPLHRWLEKRGFDPVNIFYIFGVLAMLGLALTLQAARAS